MSRRVLALLVAAALPSGSGCGGQPAESVADSLPKTQKIPAPEPPPRPQPPPEQVEPEPVAPPRPATPPTVADAEARAAEIWAATRATFFCGCRFGSDGRVRTASCGYRTRADESAARQLVWMALVPESAFGSHRRCWSEPLCTRQDGTAFSGVECCTEIDAEFRTMRTDLHNLVPVIEEIARDRSNYSFGEIDKETRLYGACDFEVDRQAERAEPAEPLRGDVARIYLYMKAVYGDALPLSADDEATLRGWAQADPPDDAEIERVARIVAIQGLAHPLIDTRGVKPAPVPAATPDDAAADDAAEPVDVDAPTDPAAPTQAPAPTEQPPSPAIPSPAHTG